MDRMFSIIPGVLNRRGLKSHAMGALVVHKAKHWIQKRLPFCIDFLNVTKITDGVLFILCDHSVALQECSGVIPELKAFLAKECPFMPISEVRITRT